MSYILEKMRHPKEICDFLDGVFEIYEIRGRVGEVNGVKFIIKTNEGNHGLPHVHAQYGEFNISISIEDGVVLAGNLPNRNKKIAVDWVLKHKDRLLNDWKNIALSTTTTMTKSKLN